MPANYCYLPGSPPLHGETHLCFCDLLTSQQSGETGNKEAPASNAPACPHPRVGEGLVSAISATSRKRWLRADTRRQLFSRPPHRYRYHVDGGVGDTAFFVETSPARRHRNPTPVAINAQTESHASPDGEVAFITISIRSPSVSSTEWERHLPLVRRSVRNILFVYNSK